MGSELTMRTRFGGIVICSNANCDNKVVNLKNNSDESVVLADLRKRDQIKECSICCGECPVCMNCAKEITTCFICASYLG